MDDKARRRKNTLQNLAIVFLSLSAVFLFAQTQLYNLGPETRQHVLDLFQSGSGSAASASADSLTDISVPVHLAITNSYGRYGDLTITTTEDDFSVPGALLASALGSAGDRSLCSEAAFRAALDRESVYCDFLSPLPLSVISGLLGSESQTGTVSVRRLLLSAEEDGPVILYTWDGADVWTRSITGLEPAELLELTAAYEPGSASFALDNAELSPDYSALDPYSLFLTDTPSLPVLYAASPLTDIDGLLADLGFNPHTNYRYEESNGSIVVVEGDSSLTIRPDGTVLYLSGSADLLRITAAGPVPTESEVVVGVTSLLNNLIGATGGLYPRQVRRSGDAFIVTLDYQFGGIPVRFAGGRPAAEVTLSGNTVSAFTLRFRQYTTTEQTALLLPLRQAVAISAREDGTELSIGYADTGEETVAPSWLAD